VGNIPCSAEKLRVSSISLTDATIDPEKVIYLNTKFITSKAIVVLTGGKPT